MQLFKIFVMDLFIKFLYACWIIGIVVWIYFLMKIQRLDKRIEELNEQLEQIEHEKKRLKSLLWKYESS